DLEDLTLEIVGRQGARRMQHVERSHYYLWNFVASPSGIPISDIPISDPSPRKGIEPGQTYVDFIGIDWGQEPSEMKAFAGTYHLAGLLVLQRWKGTRPDFHGDCFELVASAGASLRLWQAKIMSALPSDKQNPTNATYLDGFFTSPYSEDSFWRNPPAFEFRKDQPNHWTIHLPDELIKAVREKLKDEKK
ncbi:MAG: hypothetical protein ACP5XB_17555, partial [Isosphaeraceae bacterium]